MVNTIIGKTSNKINIPEQINDDGTIIKDEKNISNVFCKYFSEIGAKLANKTGKCTKTFKQYFDNNIPNYPNSMVMTETDKTEIIKIINKLQNKTSCGHDNISNKLIKGIKQGISDPLTKIFNKSINEGTVPTKLKLAEIRPIYKGKGSKKECNNYRPISILPSISKILEKIVYERLINFILKNNILDENQYGFRKNRSTIDAITNLLGHITSDHDDKKISIGLFIDMSKAFDTINFETLLYKMEKYGIRGLPLKWIKNYLTGRTQRVKFTGINETTTTSDTYTINNGVPQGSILGPLLFILYINDLSKQLNDAISITFADDTTIYITDKNIEDLYIKLYENIHILLDWCKANKLSLNLNKTNYVIFQPGAKKINEIDIPEVIIDNIEISRVNVTKFLGMYLDEKLNWNDQVNHLCTKLKQNNYLINNANDLLPKKQLINIYYAHIYSHLCYGTHIWGPYLTKAQTDKITNQQKISLRYITKSRYNNIDYNKICKNEKILKFSDIITSEILKVAYKVNNNLLPINNQNFYDTNTNVHQYNTRNRHCAKNKKHSTKLFNKSIFNRSITEWAKAPVTTKLSKNIQSFKRNIRKHFLNKY